MKAGTRLYAPATLTEHKAPAVSTVYVTKRKVVDPAGNLTPIIQPKGCSFAEYISLSHTSLLCNNNNKVHFYIQLMYTLQ